MSVDFPYALAEHSPAALAGVGSLRVDAGFDLRAHRLLLRYRVRGPLGGLRLDPAPGSLPVDRLWQHSCFEAFVAAGEARYREFNFAPNGQWAAFDFSDYRRPAAAGPAIAEAPSVELRRDGDAMVLTVQLAEAALPAAAGERALGLSAVLERRDGALAYFALAHPGTRPNFHDRRGWLCRLAAEAPA